MTFTVSEERGLAAATDVILSRLEYENEHAWGRAVARSILQLTGSDRVGIVLPSLGDIVAIAEGYDPDAAPKYREVIEPMQRRTRFLERGAALGVHDRRMLWSSYYERYLKTPYYNEYIKPYRLLSSVSMTVPLDPTVRLTTVAQLFTHCDKERGAEHEAKALALLRRLLPAFRGAVRMEQHLGRWSDRFGSVIDSLTHGVLIVDPAGSIVHQNPACTTLLSILGNDTNLRQRMIALAQAVISGGGDVGPQIIGTPSGRYRLVATWSPEHLFDRQRSVIVTIEALESWVPSAERLQERYGLTRREADVAVLLCRRKSNSEVAEALAISPHTAKRHTERVLMKTGAATRHEVARLIQG